MNGCMTTRDAELSSILVILEYRLKANISSLGLCSHGLTALGDGYGLPTVDGTRCPTARRWGPHPRPQKERDEALKLTLAEAGNPSMTQATSQGAMTHCHYASSYQADAPTQGNTGC